MSVPDKWNRRIYDLPCQECGRVSLKSFTQLKTADRLPCDHCKGSIRVADHYGFNKLNAIAKSLDSRDHILRDHNTGE
jgi:hypothetical protein